MIKNLYDSVYKPINPFLGAAKFSNFCKIKDPKHPLSKYISSETVLVEEEGEVKAMATVFVDVRAPKGLASVGLIEGIDDRAVWEELKQKVTEKCQSLGVGKLVGPIDMTPWDSFRINEDDKSRPFFSEPFFPSYYHDFFEDWDVIQKNVTSEILVTDYITEERKRGVKVLEDQGFEWMKLGSKNVEERLSDVVFLLNEGFEGTLGFVPIDQESFSFIYGDFLKNIDAAFCYLVLDKEGKGVALIIAYPDFWDPSRVVIKNMTVKKDFQRKGLATACFETVMEKASDKGIKTGLFSTMKSNQDEILKITQAESIYRTYMVYQKTFL